MAQLFILWKLRNAAYLYPYNKYGNVTSVVKWVSGQPNIDLK